MKATKSALSGPILAILVGVAMVVSAIGIVSNTVEKENNVVPRPISGEAVNITLLPADDLSAVLRGTALDYAAGDVYACQAYVMKLSYAVNISVTNMVLMFQFSKSVINTTDVFLNWTDGDHAWTSLSFTVNGDTILASFVPGTENYAKGDTARYYLSLTYAVLGAFDFKVWAEGNLA